MTLGIEAMGIFVGSLIVFSLCCLVMSLGLIIDGRKLSGGCGSDIPGKPRCDVCPKRNRSTITGCNAEGEHECRDQ